MSELPRLQQAHVFENRLCNLHPISIGRSLLKESVLQLLSLSIFLIECPSVGKHSNHERHSDGFLRLCRLMSEKSTPHCGDGISLS